MGWFGDDTIFSVPSEYFLLDTAEDLFTTAKRGNVQKKQNKKVFSLHWLRTFDVTSGLRTHCFVCLQQLSQWQQVFCSNLLAAALVKFCLHRRVGQGTGNILWRP